MATPNPTEIIELANSLLDKLPGSRQVMGMSELNAAFYVLLYEGLFAEPLPDAVSLPNSREDEIHNVQMVIDTLSLDKLNTSMSHISGQAVIARDPTAVQNLLQVFEWLYDYMLEKISEASSATPSLADDDVGVEDYDDPDLVTPELIDDVLQRELNKSHASHAESDLSVSRGRTRYTLDNRAGSSTADHRQGGNNTLGRYENYLSDRHGNSTAELIALGQYSLHEASAATADGTSDLIALGDSRYGLSPPRRGPRDDLPPPPRSSSDTGAVPSSSLLQSNYGKTSDVLSSKPPKSATQTQQRALADSSREESMAFPEKPPVVGDSTRGQFGHIGQARPPRPTATTDPRALPLSSSLQLEKDYTVTHHLYHHYNDTAPSASFAPFDGTRSLPVRLTGDSRSTDTQTTPSIAAPLPPPPPRPQEKQDRAVSPVRTLPVREASQAPKSPTLGYDHLHSLVADTVSLSRAALDTSPQPRRRNISSEATKSSQPDKQSPRRDRKASPKTGPPRTNNRIDPLRSSSGPLPRQSKKPQSILSTKSSVDKNRRKVSFLTTRLSSDEVASTDTSLDQSRENSRPGVLGRLENNINHQHGGGTRRGRTKAARKGSAVRQSNVSSALATTIPAPTPHHRSGVNSTTEDESYYSDGCVDYGADSEDEGEFMRELRAYKEKLDKRSKQVRFDDILDTQAPGRMGPICRQLLKEDRKTRKQTEFLRDRYNDEVVDYEEALKEELQKLYDAARTKDLEYKKKVLRQPRTNKYKPQEKYNIGHAGAAKSSVLYPGRGSRSRLRGNRSRKRSASASPAIRAGAEDELLPFLLEEFPYLHLAPETVHNMWKKSARQIQLLAQSEQDVRTKKSKAVQQLEDAEHKHKILVDMMKKEVKHTTKMREVEERRRQQQAVKASIRDKRLASARSRRYYEEYQLRMRAKKLKKRTKEEQIFKQLFNEGLDIQKQRIREVRKYAKEQREVKAKKNRDQVESIENYYRDQFQMLTEMLEEEKKDRTVRDKAQTKVVQDLQRDLRRRLEQEVQDIQEQICRDEDDVYFRELDAQRLRTKLKLSRFKGAAV